MSMPAFVPRRHEIWFTDGTSGFYALHVNDNAWPSSRRASCKRRTRFTATFKLRRSAKARSVRAKFGKKRVRVLRVKRGKHRVRVTVSTKGLHSGTIRYRIRLAKGKTLHRSRVFHSCS
jgi:hypothetical protein